MQTQAMRNITTRVPHNIRRQIEDDARRECRSLGGHIAWIVMRHYEQEGRSQGQEERVTNRQRQRARYDALVKSGTREMVSPDEERGQ